MKALIQRVRSARVAVGAETVGEIGPGLCVFLGVVRGDGEREMLRLAERVAHLRLFPDERDRMNRSALEVGSAALVVSQFTLAADTDRGRRPSFDRAAPTEVAERLYERFAGELASLGLPTRTGRFGARMLVEIENDGPVTFLLDEPPAVAAQDPASGSS